MCTIRRLDVERVVILVNFSDLAGLEVELTARLGDVRTLERLHDALVRGHRSIDVRLQQSAAQRTR
jgi:hypothetical protein